MSRDLFLHCPFCDIEFTIHGEREPLVSWTWVNCPRCGEAIRLNRPGEPEAAAE